MGNDGGSIPKRRELVKDAARAPTVSELKATAHESLNHAWTHDPLTSELLDFENAVSDWRGRLYNYESILKGLMPGDSDDTKTSGSANGESLELSFASTGIKSLRDIVKLKIKRYTPPGAKEKGIWACPVTLKELGASTKAVYLVPCGHVFAETAIKQIQEEVCPECSETFRSEDIIPILPTEKSDLEKLATRNDKLRSKGLTHSLKKDKTSSKKKRKADEVNEVNGNRSGKGKEAPPKATPKSDLSSRVSGINNAMTASLTAKVLAEQEDRNKRRKLAAAGN
ncbi:Rtf2 RING-finger-domain-containing protein [Apiosordaria backusii]|uniref:Rtf2 RING-finger-domain-containing protein n=1 Tax=Apiosordaria backusii TaxID=314023 RepID=A0AA40DIR1_9PEZI|nr:Rtf2 RING-finger-domain-containing protein [Apiosordaria backusii]